VEIENLFVKAKADLAAAEAADEAHEKLLL
jgi:hypothetical protein